MDSAIIRSIFYIGGSEFINKAAIAVLYIYLARILGSGPFGELIFSTTIVLYFLIFVTGWLDVIGLRDVSRDHSLVRKCSNNIIAMRFVIALIAYAALAVFISIADQPAEVKTLVFIGGLSVIASAVMLDWIFQGLESMRIIFIGTLFQNLLYVSIVLLVVNKPTRLLWVPAVKVAADFLYVGLLYARYAKYWGHITPSFDALLWMDAAKEGFPLLLGAIATNIYNYSDRLLLGFMTDHRQVGYYVAAFTLMSAGSIPAVVLWKVFCPRLSRAYVRRDLLARTVRHYRLLLTAIGITVGVGGFLFGGWLITFVYGTEYLAATRPLKILMVSTAVNYIGMAFSTPLLVWNKQKQFTYLVVAGATVNLISNLIFIPVWGIVGAAVASLISMSVVACWSILKYRNVYSKLVSHPTPECQMAGCGVIT